MAVNKANAVPIKTTLYQCYEAAGKVDATEWDDSNTTYKDGTVHTLKFYYLERGNYDSHLTLKYNLTEIPETAIYKVDQYGDTVPGATFAVYAADEKYTLLDKKNGQKVTLPDKYVYDTSGNIVDDQGQPLANALYTGITNQDGEMIFADMDGMPYSINELQDMFGDRFILREIKVPDGYRVVSKDIHLQFWKGESQTILKCDNTEQSGSRAASRLQITATDTLYLQEAYHGETTVQYYDPSIGKPFGTLFLNLLKFIVVPIVLFSIMNGVISMKDIKKVGSIGGKTVIYYMGTTFFAVTLGLVVANLFKKGFPVLSTSSLEYTATETPSFIQTLIGIFPSNIIQPMAEASMLQVIVVACSA